MATPHYDEFFCEILDNYLLYFGKEKFLKIFNKIQSSNKISDLIRVSHQKRIVPNRNDFLYSLNEVPYFIFSGNDILTFGSILALNRWNEECNKHLILADELELMEIIMDIIEEAQKH